MGISVVLRDETNTNMSEIVPDADGVIARTVPCLDDTSYNCLRFIDPYGDTVFNRLQSAVALQEWDRLKFAFAQANAESLWGEVRELLARCSREPHTYVRFIGE